ncbi:MAG: sugar phosphate nucleotidyltransferase [Candidatus Eisenbacteria bacterium]
MTRVSILSQYRPASLIEHVGTGESWDFVGLDRTAKILPPFWGGEAGDWYQGNADAVDQNWNFLADVEADLVLVISGDHIYRTDYRELIEAHLDSGADFTVAVKKMAYDPHYGYATLDSANRVVSYVEKPDAPRDDHASLTIYLANTKALREVFDSEPGRRGELLEFSGKDVIPYARAAPRPRLGLSGLLGLHPDDPDVLRSAPGPPAGTDRSRRLGSPDQPQDTLVASPSPARWRQAEINGSLVGTGCEIEGR